MKLSIRMGILTAAVVFWQAGGIGAQPVAEIDLDARITSDGLHRVDPSVMEAAWVRPGLDLGQYTSILFMPTVASFREVNRPSYNVRTNNETTIFPVSDEWRERLPALFGETFYEDLAEVEPYEINTGVGRDVLMVQGYLVDVVSGTPPNLPGSGVTVVRRPWEATVVLELRDSMSNDLLARTIDRQIVDGSPRGFSLPEIPGVTRYAIGQWSALLCRHLEELSDLGAASTQSSRLEP